MTTQQQNKLILPLFIHASYIDSKGIEKEADIQTRGLGSSQQDCQIGDFSENWYIRPSKAVKYKEYTTIKNYKLAIILSMKSKGMKVIAIYEKIDVDGIEYTKLL